MVAAHASGAAAFLAWLFDDGALAAAYIARDGAHELAKTAHARDLTHAAAAVTLRAGLAPRAAPGAAAGAGLALFVGSHLDLFRSAEDGF